MIKTFILWNEDKMIGPVLQHEINKFSDEHFGYQRPTVEEEELFKLRYPHKYEQQLQKYWIDFVAAKLMSLEFVGKFMINPQIQSIYNNWFHLTRVGEKDLLLTYSHEADRNYISRISFELTEYLSGIYNMYIGGKFYISRSKNKMLYGSEADVSYIAESTQYHPN